MHSPYSQHPIRLMVTGTDTDAGKSLVAAALLHGFNQQGLCTIGLKPIAAGCEMVDGIWQNDDARLLRQYSQGALSYEKHNPIALPDPVAPHISAQKVGLTLSADQVLSACQTTLKERYDALIIEGAGGWRVPLNDHETLADAVQQMAQEYPIKVILVVGIKLGCINHALLSMEAIKKDGLSVAGWVANGIDPAMAEPACNIRFLTDYFTRLGVPHLGTIPHLSTTEGKVQAAAKRLDFSQLSTVNEH